MTLEEQVARSRAVVGFLAAHCPNPDCPIGCPDEHSDIGLPDINCGTFRGAPVSSSASWLIYFDDADMRPEMFSSEEAARQRFVSLSVNWGVHLFRLVESL